MEPNSDREAVSLIIKGMLATGHKLMSVFDTEENIFVNTEEEALDAIFAVDTAHLHLRLPNGDTGWIWFVLGNDPEEVAADYTVNLDPHVDNIVSPWWN